MAVDDSRDRTIWHPKARKKLSCLRLERPLSRTCWWRLSRKDRPESTIASETVAGKPVPQIDFRDAFFIGFSPEITVGVWVGQDGVRVFRKGKPEQGRALPIWTAFMSAVLQDRPYQHFGIPDSISQVRMDPRTGTLASDDMPGAITILVRKP